MNISSTLFAKTIKQKFIENDEEYYDGGLGENPLPQPPLLLDVIEEHKEKKEYTSARGLPELQKLLGKRIIVGNGLKPLLFLIQLAFHKLYPNGIIYHIVPFWVSYEEQTKILGINSKRIYPSNTKTWKVTAEDLENQMEPDRHNMIIFNNPCNPSGCVYTPEEVEKISRVFREHKSFVVADDIYEDIVHENKMLGQIKDFYSKTISGSSLSKMVACGGYRFGWLVFNSPDLSEIYEVTNIMASSIYSCPSIVFQHVAIATLEYPPHIVKYLTIQRKIFTDLKNHIKEKLKDTKLILSDSNAAWYMLINFDNYREKLAKLDIYDSEDLSKYLIEEKKIIMVGGKNFGIEDQLVLRYSFVEITDIDMEILDYNIEKINILLFLLKEWLK